MLCISCADLVAIALSQPSPECWVHRAVTVLREQSHPKVTAISHARTAELMIYDGRVVLKMMRHDAKHTLSLQDVANSFWQRKANVISSCRDTTGATASLLHRVYTAILARAHGAVAAIAHGAAVRKISLIAIIAQRLGNPAEIISIDIEMHGWPSTPTRVHIGSFGWHFCEDENLRGW